MQSPNLSKAWRELRRLTSKQSGRSISALFEADPNRAETFSSCWQGLRFDYSRTLITDEILSQLLALAEHCEVMQRATRMFAGEKINTTEQRAVLHIALRDSDGFFADAYGANIHQQVIRALGELEAFSEQLRRGELLGHSGKAIKHIVNIGIGGSDLGPRMVCQALRAQMSATPVSVSFVSNVDETHLAHQIRGLNPEQTLFIVSSKTFSTQETLLNAQAARDWLLDYFGDRQAVAAHFVAVSANREAAIDFGVAAERIFEFWDWVGGRYSLWSSIGAPIAVNIGYDGFAELLAGAHAMDRHFLEAEPRANLPLLLALLGIWHINFCDFRNLAVIPYNDALSLLPNFLQQLDMESNGKNIDLQGQAIDYATGPVVWGQNGSDGQHAFFQSLHQGSLTIPIEFVAALNPGTANINQHKVLLANMFAQASALMNGEANTSHAHASYAGNKPSSSLLLEALSPYNLGALIALYEHKVFVQGAIWNINSFDQWGVQLGKRLANDIGSDFDNPADTLDAPTRAAMRWAAENLKK